MDKSEPPSDGKTIRKPITKRVYGKVAFLVVVIGLFAMAAEAFKIVGALLVVVSCFVFSIALYKIIQGHGTLNMFLLFCASVVVLGGYFVVIPFVVRTAAYKKHKTRLVGMIQS